MIDDFYRRKQYFKESILSRQDMINVRYIPSSTVVFIIRKGVKCVCKDNGSSALKTTDDAVLCGRERKREKERHRARAVSM